MERNYHARRHFSVLLRLWQEDQAGRWRASIENPADGTVLLFADAAEAWMYLQDRMSPPSASPDAVQVAFNPEDVPAIVLPEQGE